MFACVTVFSTKLYAMHDPINTFFSEDFFAFVSGCYSFALLLMLSQQCCKMQYLCQKTKAHFWLLTLHTGLFHLFLNRKYNHFIISGRFVQIHWSFCALFLQFWGQLLTVLYKFWSFRTQEPVCNKPLQVSNINYNYKTHECQNEIAENWVFFQRIQV